MPNYERFCEGCIYSGVCVARLNNGEGKCPCTQCLVKVMCKGNCVHFREFYSKVSSSSLLKELRSESNAK